MSLTLHGVRLLQQLSSLPVEVHEQGSLVLAAGAATGKLLMLKEGAVEVVLDGVRVAEVSEPGAVFGEIALLLGRPHAADVRALRRSTFHVADGRSYPARRSGRGALRRDGAGPAPGRGQPPPGRGQAGAPVGGAAAWSTR